MVAPSRAGTRPAPTTLLLSHPEQRQRIVAEIERDFRRPIAILVLDSCGFTRTVRAMGIIHFLALLERTAAYKGRYHVLGGAINPIAGIGPEHLRIRELLTRLNDGAIQEVIIAIEESGRQ